MTTLSFRSIIIALVVALTATGAVFAQDGADFALRPDAYVRGWGAIPIMPDNSSSTARPNMGFFHFNVNVFQGVVVGSVNFREVTPAGKLVAYMHTRQLKSLEINGNFATIQADGVFNGKSVCLFFEVLDDNPSGDWARFQANGCMLTVIYYDKAAGLVQGDVQVWKRPPPPAVAAGNGAISLPTPIGQTPRLGVFSFKAQSGPDGPFGYIHYVDGPWNRYGTRIDVARLEKFEAFGKKALLAGKGWLNGQPAEVVVTVEDNCDPRLVTFAPQPPDIFAISATTIVPPWSERPVVHYEQKGPVVKGDLFVKAVGPVDTQ